MKMHLVMTAAFVGLCSHAAFAASEGGDTWSALQAQAYPRSIQSPVAATSASSSSLQRGFSIAASEGGDTWSALAATSVSSGSLQRGLPTAASEGGDTWSELQPRHLGEGTPALMAGQ